MTWTLDELIAEAATRLSAAGVDQASPRVRDVPDRRTARYYTQLGLLDAPAGARGQRGTYGERQLLQLLAIKRLQARGEPLAQIQQRLLGISTRRLRELAEPPGEAPRVAEASASATALAPAPALPAAVHQAVALNAEVTLLVRPRRALLAADDVEAIRVASEPLLRLLRARHLIGGDR